MTSTSIRTISGKWIDLANPKPEDIDWVDIIKGLPNIARFGGQIMRGGDNKELVYSVGQHSLLASFFITEDENAEPALVLAALLHDAAEAYIGDVVRPMKAMFPEIKDRLEIPLATLIFDKAGLDPDLINHPRVKKVDNRLLVTEIEALHPLGLWTKDHPLTPIEEKFGTDFTVWKPSVVEYLLNTRLNNFLILNQSLTTHEVI